MHKITYQDKLILRLLYGTCGIKSTRLYALARVICLESAKRGGERIATDWKQDGKQLFSWALKDLLRDLVAAKLIRTVTSNQGETITYAPIEGVPILPVGKQNEILIFNLHKRRYHTCPWRAVEALERAVSGTKPVDILALK